MSEVSREQGYKAALSLSAEVGVSPVVHQTLLDQALSLPTGVYEDSFETRGHFLSATGDMVSTLKDSPLGAGINLLRDGSIVSLLIKNLPTDPQLPWPPIDGKNPHDKKTFVSEGLALGVARVLGEPSIIVGEKQEALVHQITPVPGRENTQSNEGSVSLRLHQDLAPLPDMPSMPYGRFMPDWLILTGLQKGSDTTRTYIAPVDAAAEMLPPRTEEVLRERRFITSPPDSFVKEHPELAVMPLPKHAILTNYAGHLESVFDYSSAVRPNDPEDKEAAKALTELEHAFDQVKTEVVVEPGTMVAFNNRRVTHGRSSVATEVDYTTKRWIQRAYVYDYERVLRESMGRPWTVSLGAGMVAVGQVAVNSRLMELAGLK